MSGWIPLIIFLMALLGVLSFLLIRYLRMQLGLREQGYGGGVQHSPKLEPDLGNEEIFLPGSRVSDLVDSDAELAAYDVQASSSSKAKRLFRSKEDIRRSYIIDALLERPKF